MGKAAVQQHLVQLNNRLDALEEQLKGYSHEQLNWSPNEETWSVTQIMNHLYLAEGYSLKYLQKKMSYNPTFKKTSLSARWRILLLKVYLDLPIKFPAPKGVSTEYLPKESDAQEVLAKWREQRNEIAEFLAQQPEDLYTREVYKHPFAGRLPFSGMVLFYERHYNRHLRQMNRMLKALPQTVEA